MEKLTEKELDGISIICEKMEFDKCPCGCTFEDNFKHVCNGFLKNGFFRFDMSQEGSKEDLWVTVPRGKIYAFIEEFDV